MYCRNFLFSIEKSRTESPSSTTKYPIGKIQTNLHILDSKKHLKNSPTKTKKDTLVASYLPLDSVQDMVSLDHLNEASILSNLRRRFDKNSIYVCKALRKRNHSLFQI